MSGPEKNDTAVGAGQEHDNDTSSKGSSAPAVPETQTPAGEDEYHDSFPDLGDSALSTLQSVQQKTEPMQGNIDGLDGQVGRRLQEIIWGVQYVQMVIEEEQSEIEIFQETIERLRGADEKLQGIVEGLQGKVREHQRLIETLRDDWKNWACSCFTGKAGK